MAFLRRRKEELDERSAPYVISPKLLLQFRPPRRRKGEPDSPPKYCRVIFVINLHHALGRIEARKQVYDEVYRLRNTDPKIVLRDINDSRHHVFALIDLASLKALVAADLARPPERRGIYKVEPDRELQPFLDRSVRTIKGDACLRSFGADGEDILWAVVDSGIEATHPHFKQHGNLNLPLGNEADDAGPPALRHRDFTYSNKEEPGIDAFGHGTHVAGIIAGVSPDPEFYPVIKVAQKRLEPNGADSKGRVRAYLEPARRPLQGVAPKCKLISLKVLDDKGEGSESSLLAALDYVAKVNDDGRMPRIHGVNLSLGYPFEAEWFAAGQSPICVAVNRLASMGVVVVAAAGNDGSAFIQSEMSSRARRMGLDQSIADPGNAAGAITVGSTHPASPHTYGVSYFSSRGPTADGRPKPDLVAPGERIVSCASSGSLERLVEKNSALKGEFSVDSGEAYYREESGTSMAAPHVSGAVAAFLSIHREFKGQPERVKQVFKASATDLERKVDFQGAGLVDLMRAVQSV